MQTKNVEVLVQKMKIREAFQITLYNSKHLQYPTT